MTCFHTAETGKQLLRTQNVSEQNQKHFLCPGHKICFRNKCCARGETGKHDISIQYPPVHKLSFQCLVLVRVLSSSPHCKGPVIRTTFPCNLSRNIVALQVAKLCCLYYHLCKQLVAQQISVLQVAATCCTK